MKFILTTALALICSCILYSQQEVKKTEPSGKVTGQIFLNYHYDFTNDAEKKSQFEILRSNFGYVHTFSDKLISRITIDAANDGKAFSVFLKAASLEWKVTNAFTIEGGMMKTFMFDTQEDLWGNRYVMETVQDRNRFYTPFDLGLKAAWKPVEFIQLRAGIYNGEGYKKLQDEFGMHRTALDIILFPAKGFTLKAYYDFMPKRDTAITNRDLLYNQSTTGFFAGYDKPGKFRFGIGYDIQSGNLHRKDHNLGTFSAHGTITVRKAEIFARFDRTNSNNPGEAILPWNIARDYSMLMGGLQASFSKLVRASVNFRHYIPSQEGSSPSDLAYLNLEIRF